MIKKGELYRILYRLVENITDRRKLYNFFKKFLRVFDDDSELINPDVLPDNLGDIMDRESNVIKSKYLPSYVDDVLEGYYVNGIFYKTRTGKPGSYAYSDPYTPETGKIYVDLNVDDNPTYRWSGSAYVVISESCSDKNIVLKIDNNNKINYTYDDILYFSQDERHNYIYYTLYPNDDKLYPTSVILDSENKRFVCHSDYFIKESYYRNGFYLNADSSITYDTSYQESGKLENLANKVLVISESKEYKDNDVLYPSMKALDEYINIKKIQTSVPSDRLDTRVLSTKAILDYIDTKIRTYDIDNVVLNSSLNPFTGEENKSNIVENNTNDSTSNNAVTNSSKSHIEGSANIISDVSVAHVEGSINKVESASNVHIEGYSNSIKGENSIHIEGKKVSIQKSTSQTSSYAEGAHVGGYNPVDWTGKGFISDNIIRQIGAGISDVVSRDACVITKSGKIYFLNVGGFIGISEQTESFKDVATVISELESGSEIFKKDIIKIKNDIVTINNEITVIESDIDTINSVLEEHTTQITTNANNISSEIDRATKVENEIKNNLSTETAERKDADNKLTEALNIEIEARKSADDVLTNNLNSEIAIRKSEDADLLSKINAEITNRENAISSEAAARKEGDDAITVSLNTEIERAKNAESVNANDIDIIESKIPNTASAENQLADKDFVNSSVATATATFRGTYKTLIEIEAITEADKNDYAFYNHIDEVGNVLFDRYTYDGMDWKYEYTLNNSSFTASQWAAINSEITKQKITEIDTSINNLNSNLTDEIARAKGAEEINSKAIIAETSERKTEDNTLQANINNEAEVRGNADNTLQTNIDNEASTRESEDKRLLELINKESKDRSNAYTNLSATINNEIARAKEAEETLTTNLATEVQNRIDGDSALDTKLADEIARAKSAESTLTTNFNNEITARTDGDESLDAKLEEEITRAKAAEKTNADNIATEINDRTTAISTEEIARIAGDKVNSDFINAEAAARSDADDSLDIKISDEAITRKNADDDLLSKITDETSARTSADSDLEDKISTEATTRKNADDDLLSKINAEATTRDNADTVLTNNLNGEISAREAADKTIKTQIGDEVAARKVADTTLEGKISDEVIARSNADTTLQNDITTEIDRATETENELASRITTIEDYVQDGTSATNQLVNKDYVDAISGGTSAELAEEIAARKQGDTNLQTNITTETNRAKKAEESLSSDINIINSKISAEASSTNQLADKAWVNTQIGIEKTNREKNDYDLQIKIDTEVNARETAIKNITDLIPDAVDKDTNKLADKAFVNSSIATSTATFRGTSAENLTEAEFIIWANGLAHDDNDYVYWNTKDEAGNVLYKRYKYNGDAWVYEYTLNNSSFTSDEWKAIQSGITDNLVAKLNAIADGAEVNVQSDWNVTDTSSDAYIKNKPANLVQDSTYVHTDNNFTSVFKTKLEGIENSANVNKIETVKVNGTALSIDSNKAVNVIVPTKTSDITNNSNYAVDSNYVHTDNNYTTTEKTKLERIAEGAEVNVISSVSVNQTVLVPSNKNVNITVPIKLSDLSEDTAHRVVTDTEKSAWNNKQDAITTDNKLAYSLISGAPTIPTVGNGTITITQNGTTKGSFTMNQSGNATIALIDNDTTYSSKDAASGGTDVSLVTTGEKYAWNNKQESLPLRATGNNKGVVNNNYESTDGVSDINGFGFFASRKSTIDSNGSIVVGMNNNVTGYDFNFTLGSRNKVTNEYGTNIGYGNIVTGKLGTTIGYRNQSTGLASCAISGLGKASGDYSFAIGASWCFALYLTSRNDSDTTYDVTGNDIKYIKSGDLVFIQYNIYEYRTVAEIDLTNNTITFDETLGTLNNTCIEFCATIARGNYSIAHRGIANGSSSITMGRGSVSNGDVSISIGEFLEVNNRNETSFGVANKSNSTTLFSIGNGTGIDDRKNAFEITKDNKLYVPNLGGYDGTNGDNTAVKDLVTIINAKQNALSSGTNIKTINSNSLLGSGNIKIQEGISSIKTGSGPNSEVFNNGAASNATGNSSHVEGVNTKATANNAHAEGGDTEANGNNSHAEGYRTIANGRWSHSEGGFTITNAYGSHAGGIGNISDADAIYQVGVGTMSSDLQSITTRKDAFRITTDGRCYINNVGNFDGTIATASLGSNVKDLATIINAYETRIAALESALDGVLTQLQSI